MNGDGTGSGPGTVYDTYLALYGYPSQASTISKAMTYNAFLKYKATMLPMNMSTPPTANVQSANQPEVALSNSHKVRKVY